MTQAQSSAVDLTQVFSLGALSFRNRLINGAMLIPQRVALNATATTGWAFGQCDRWQMYCNAPSAAMSQAQAAGAYGGMSRMWSKAMVTTPPTDISGNNMIVPHCQTIEGCNAYDLGNGPIAVSFLFNASAVGQYSVALNVSNAADVIQGCYLTTINYTTPQTPQLVKIIIPQMPGNYSVSNSNNVGMRFSLGSVNTGAQFQAPSANTWLAAAGYYSLPGNVNWTSVAGNWIMVTDLQIEPGSVVTPFERRPHGLEYELCRRYYQSLRAELGAYGLTAGQIAAYFQFGTIMRANPTAIVAAATYNNASSFVIDTLLPSGFRAYATVASQGVGFVTGTSINFIAEI